MALAHDSLPGTAPPFSPARTIRLIGLTLALGYLVVLGGTFLKGDFLLDQERRPIANDFVNVVAAGRLALDGNAAAAYDWPTHKQAEVRAIGHDFDDYYGWHYPPTFLFVAAALATLPFVAAAIVSLVATLAAYVAAMTGILGRTGIFVALGFPAALWNVTAGQNGFLTAALVGGTLGLLERRPALAGICLGLLTYKPQFGLLFPLVLIADRRWLTIAVAAAVAATLAALSWLAFGATSWQAFAHWLPITSHEISRRRPRRLRPIAKPVWPHSRSRRQRAIGVDGAGDRQPRRHRRRHAAVAKPRAVRSQGGGACCRHARRDALCVYV